MRRIGALCYFPVRTIWLSAENISHVADFRDRKRSKLTPANILPNSLESRSAKPIINEPPPVSTTF